MIRVTNEKDDSETGVAMVELADVVVQRFHHIEVDRGADPGKTQLQPEHKIQLLAFEPEHCVVVLSHCQRFTSDSAGKMDEFEEILIDCWLRTQK